MAAPKDNFKWFGEGFDGFPKHSPEDTVEYSLFILNADLSTEEHRARLKVVHEAAEALRETHLKDYMWQRGEFKVELETADDISCLHGRTNFGDSIEDEWLIVFLIRELTLSFPDLWAKIVDTDGQFLLIEAANALPKWLNPEVADNRVWLNQGHISIIPVTIAGAEPAPVHGSLKLKEGLNFIEKHPRNLYLSTDLEKEAFHRLRNYPEQISKNLHRALVIIPKLLAFIIHEKPSSVSLAVEAFYLRDEVAMRPLRESEDRGSSVLVFPPKDLVSVAVRFTKVGYAQIQSQQYAAPTVWEPFIAPEADLRPSETGMKLACAYEMLFADPQYREKESVTHVRVLLSSVARGEIAVPSEQEMQSWNKAIDDESWLSVDFADFERELSGDKTNGGGSGKGKGAPTFSDESTQGNLRKMVERFEAFLNDDTAGPDGIVLPEDMDSDDEEDDRSDASSAGEDKMVSFDEAEFARMMREMMGMPPENSEESSVAHPVRNPVWASRKDPTDPSDYWMETVGRSADGVDTEEELATMAGIRQEMQGMETELKAAGALNLDPLPQRNHRALGVESHNGERDGAEVEEEEEEDDDADVQIDFELAKNLLESFKSQGGSAGPAGNLLGMLGMRLPRDEQDGDDDEGTVTQTHGIDQRSAD